MKTFQIITIILLVTLSSVCFSEQERPSSPQEAPKQELKIDEINLEELPTESQNVSDLAAFVKDKESDPTIHESLLASLVKLIYKKQLVIAPIAEGVVYINGELCHVGNYYNSSIYTVLEGPRYGCQTVLNLYGEIVSINYNFTLEHTSAGIVFHHFYPDSVVITGATQVVVFD